MSTETAVEKSAMLDMIVSKVIEGVAAAEAQKLDLFARHYLRRVPEDELNRREVAAWCGLIRNHFELMAKRIRGQTEVRIFNPTVESHGWESSHTVIEILTDDMPFLVDSTTLAIGDANISIHLIIHPVFRAVRDEGGYLMQLAPLQQELEDSTAESVMHFEVDRQTEPRVLGDLRDRIVAYLSDVNKSVRDWHGMRERIDAACEHLEQADTPYSAESLEETIEFLRWLADDHFTLLGYREYEIQKRDGERLLVPVSGTGLGILAGEQVEQHDRSKTRVKDAAPEAIAESGPMIITKTNSRATVHRAGYMDYIGVMSFDAAGELAGERRFLGLYTSSAYNRRPWNIPFVRRKVQGVMQASGFAPETHGGKALLHIMETLPRDELFQASMNELYELVIGIFDLQERQKTRLFIRADRFHRFYSCLVFIPRERFNTEIRERIQGILKRSLQGDSVDFSVQVSESMLARLHVIVHVRPDRVVSYDATQIERRLVEAVRSWYDRLKDILVEKHGEDVGIRWARRFGEAFPAAYIEEVTPRVAAFDVENLAGLAHEDDLKMSLYRPRKSTSEGMFRFKTFRCSKTIPLSDVLPMLENMGLRIVSERPYKLQLDDGSLRWIQDFDMFRVGGSDVDLERVKEKFQEAFQRVARGEMESDGFNRLILLAGLSWRQVTVIRSYCKYLLQTGVPFSQAYMEQTLGDHPVIARSMVELFEAQFDPARAEESRSAREQRGKALLADLTQLYADAPDSNVVELIEQVGKAQSEGREQQMAAARDLLRCLIEQVRSLDEDRILRAFIGAIRASLRTNAFQSNDREQLPYLSIKMDSKQVPDLPRPRPWREIFVYSPRVEGIHLRGGPVARGGLRWSDRKEDFRTEVLGLMKAQMVKNTMIVPVGAKGGFVVKHLPESGDRDELMAEVVACYRFFIHGLLDITDNLRDDALIHPDNVVRHDPDDPYLVVAADKGTATFSDIANSVSEAHDFWMGDAFASGGSAGYDHKKMGITARGAWESVKRHFRDLGVDCQREDFTVVGIGDMAGDVFGNGMLLSPHIKLKAAFNHLHIFLDPDPDPALSYKERQRLFELPRSAWSDYDVALISKGGGVYSRRDKTIPISPEVGRWLGIKSETLAPQELIRELLKAPVDLLWNGGIGTYVKSSAESHGEVGDRANDALRVDGKDLRCRIIGEGGNLGLTQRGRIEYALAGGRLNTDFIDNSGGVDCSDHEVNIKILLNRAMAEGHLGLEERNALLAEMTEEVAELVLRNNYLQSQAISMMEALTVERLGSKAHFIDVLEAQGILDRELEFLPSRDEIDERRKSGIGLTRPELAVLLSYSKITLYDRLLDSDVPEDPYLSKELVRYFPQPLQESFAPAMETHRLRREIIATVVTNSMVNRMGATFSLRMQEDTGSGPADIAKAYSAAREIFDARRLWEAIEAHDNRVPSQDQVTAQLMVWNLIRHATRWLLNRHRAGLDIAGLVERYRQGCDELMDKIADLAVTSVARKINARRQELERIGFDVELARTLAGVPALNPSLDIVEVALGGEGSIERIAGIYFHIEKALKLSWLMNQVEDLPVSGQWHAHARGGLRDELYRQHRALTAKIMSHQDGTGDPAAIVSEWMAAHQAHLHYFEHMMADMRNSGSMDYATVTVAVRALEQLVTTM